MGGAKCILRQLRTRDGTSPVASLYSFSKVPSASIGTISKFSPLLLPPPVFLQRSPVQSTTERFHWPSLGIHAVVYVARIITGGANVIYLPLTRLFAWILGTWTFIAGAGFAWAL